MLDQKFFKENRQELEKLLDNNSLVLIYSGREIPQSLDQNYPYYYDNNFYYLTGLKEPDNLLLIYKNNEGRITEDLFIPAPDPFQERWFGYKNSIDQAKEISGIENIFFEDKLNNYIDNYLSSNPTIKIDYSQPLHQRFAHDERLFELYTVEDTSELFQKLRIIKKEDEIEAIKKAAEISNKAIIEILKDIKPGQYEYEPAALFEYIIKKNGAESLSFPTIAASGPNGPILHYSNNNKLLKENELILFDLGGRYKGYCADISRTIPVNGKFTDLQEKFYKAVLNAQKEIIKNYKRGSSLKDIQLLTKKLLEENLKKEGIQIPKEGIEEWYYHNIGHSLGLDTHDTANRDLILEDGMVITCEPGIYAQEYDIGIRIEDDILINGDEPIILTESIPKEIEEIEQIMN